MDVPFQRADRKPHIFSLSLLLLLLVNFHLVSCNNFDGVVVTQADYQALNALKHELVDPRGVLRSWNNASLTACSGWVGIKCVNGQVIAINLPWRGLGGRISEKIGQLRSLRRLSLHDNLLVGSVPASLGFLPNLRGVYLFNNRLSGSIPPSIGNCLLLQNLDFSNNQLSGVIPPSLANSTRLYRLNLSSNGFSGGIPVRLSQSQSLTFLALQHNNLSGSVPESFVNLKNLSSFDVSYNNLSGSVPSVLAKKFNPTSFLGNIHLCGYSSSTPCDSLAPAPAPAQESNLPAQTKPKKNHNRKLSTKDIILIAAGALLLVLLILCCVLICCLFRKKTGAKARRDETGEPKAVPGASGGDVEMGTESGGKLVHFDGGFVFTADDLLCASAEIMGKSSYGTAYKATLEEDNKHVAVKRLREKITKVQKEFEVEVSQLGKIRHANILALRAYYLGPKGEKLLVYDYMPNGSLATFLHARGPETAISWPTRMNIAIGITRGLCYLHTEQNTVHGNLTSSNILLDDHNNPKIADVGLSRLMTTTANTNVVATAGTMGYRAPEFSSKHNKHAIASTKSDIFSLGVIILELLTGKSPSESTDGLDLPQWVASIVKEEWSNQVFDVELIRDESNIGDQLLNTLKLALHCVDPEPAARPQAQQLLQKLQDQDQIIHTTTGGEI